MYHSVTKRLSTGNSTTICRYATKAQITSGGKSRPGNCRFILVATQAVRVGDLLNVSDDNFERFLFLKCSMHSGLSSINVEVPSECSTMEPTRTAMSVAVWGLRACCRLPRRAARRLQELVHPGKQNSSYRNLASLFRALLINHRHGTRPPG